MSTSSLNFHKQLIQEKGVDDATGFSQEGQRIRFDVILRWALHLQDETGRLLDYGCNVGDLHQYCLRHGYHFDYTGVDEMLPFVERLKSRFPEVNALQGSITEDGLYAKLKESPFDYVVASGVFCYADALNDHPLILSRLWSITRKAMVVNFLSALTPLGKRSEKPIHCFYHPSFANHTAQYLDCRSFAVFHDYRPNDWTLVLYRNFREGNYEPIGYS